jgi:hypothetical protein
VSPSSRPVTIGTSTSRGLGQASVYVISGCRAHRQEASAASVWIPVLTCLPRTCRSSTTASSREAPCGSIRASFGAREFCEICRAVCMWPEAPSLVVGWVAGIAVLLAIMPGRTEVPCFSPAHRVPHLTGAALLFSLAIKYACVKVNAHRSFAIFANNSALVKGGAMAVFNTPSTTVPVVFRS